MCGSVVMFGVVTLYLTMCGSVVMFGVVTLYLTMCGSVVPMENDGPWGSYGQNVFYVNLKEPKKRSVLAPHGGLAVYPGDVSMGSTPGRVLLETSHTHAYSHRRTHIE